MCHVKKAYSRDSREVCISIRTVAPARLRRLQCAAGEMWNTSRSCAALSGTTKFVCQRTEMPATHGHHRVTARRPRHTTAPGGRRTRSAKRDVLKWNLRQAPGRSPLTACERNGDPPSGHWPGAAHASNAARRLRCARCVAPPRRRRGSPRAAASGGTQLHRLTSPSPAVSMRRSRPHPRSRPEASLVRRLFFAGPS